MKLYTALDVSLRSVAICVIDEQGVVRYEAKVEADVDRIVACMRSFSPDLQIVGFDRIHETAFRPWARGAPDTIPRRYCSGQALVSDARKRQLYYWIGEDTGWIGATWGVEWCVVGLDRNWAYNPGCRMARP